MANSLFNYIVLNKKKQTIFPLVTKSSYGYSSGIRSGARVTRYSKTIIKTEYIIQYKKNVSKHKINGADIRRKQYENPLTSSPIKCTKYVFILSGSGTL